MFTFAFDAKFKNVCTIYTERGLYFVGTIDTKQNVLHKTGCGVFMIKEKLVEHIFVAELMLNDVNRFYLRNGDLLKETQLS